MGFSPFEKIEDLKGKKRQVKAAHEILRESEQKEKDLPLEQAKRALAEAVADPEMRKQIIITTLERQADEYVAKNDAFEKNIEKYQQRIEEEESKRLSVGVEQFGKDIEKLRSGFGESMKGLGDSISELRFTYMRAASDKNDTGVVERAHTEKLFERQEEETLEGFKGVLSAAEEEEANAPVTEAQELLREETNRDTEATERLMGDVERAIRGEGRDSEAVEVLNDGSEDDLIESLKERIRVEEERHKALVLRMAELNVRAEKLKSTPF